MGRRERGEKEVGREQGREHRALRQRGCIDGSSA